MTEIAMKHDTSAQASPQDVLARLADTLDGRRGADPEQSYVARLYAKGDDAVLKKIAEEAGEVLMAAKDARHANLSALALQTVVNETADLWFHSLIMLAHLGLRPEQVIAELARREGMSGLEEKALRKIKAREAGE
jgi:phosphoribosyl-ATP pyrophosphohydrolase